MKDDIPVINEELIVLLKEEKIKMETKVKLNIITPVSRADNLYILKAIIEQELFEYFDVKWYCVYDSGKEIAIVYNNTHWIYSVVGGVPNDYGASQRNVALDMIKDGWVYFLDDDNVLYRGFGKRVKEIIEQNPSKGAFVINQVREDRTLFAKPENISVGNIDTAQIVIKRELINKYRWFDEIYQCDYYFIKRIYKRHSEKFEFMNENLCHYNYLRK